MSALCSVTPYLYYSALLIGLYLSLSIPVPNALFQFLCLTLTDFKMCLLELLYHKDCTTTRQSWLFPLRSCKQKQKNKKQDKMKLENIYRVESLLISYENQCLLIIEMITSIS